MMVNFDKLRISIQEYDCKREDLIKKSRDVLKLSKQLIYSVHRDEMDQANGLLEEIKSEVINLDKIAVYDPKLVYEGSYKVAIQEYVEAVLYYNFIKNGDLIDLDVIPTHYILGLADLPGELVRKAVYLAGKEKYSEVVKIKDMVDDIYGKLLEFDFRNNEIRKKVDGIKYDLRKLEDLVLDLKLKGKI